MTCQHSQTKGNEWPLAHLPDKLTNSISTLSRLKSVELINKKKSNAAIKYKLRMFKHHSNPFLYDVYLSLRLSDVSCSLWRRTLACPSSPHIPLSCST